MSDPFAGINNQLTTAGDSARNQAKEMALEARRKIFEKKKTIEEGLSGFKAITGGKKIGGVLAKKYEPIIKREAKAGWEQFKSKWSEQLERRPRLSDIRMKPIDEIEDEDETGAEGAGADATTGATQATEGAGADAGAGAGATTASQATAGAGLDEADLDADAVSGSGTLGTAASADSVAAENATAAAAREAIAPALKTDYNLERFARIANMRRAGNIEKGMSEEDADGDYFNFIEQKRNIYNGKQALQQQAKQRAEQAAEQEAQNAEQEAQNAGGTTALDESGLQADASVVSITNADAVVAGGSAAAGEAATAALAAEKAAAELAAKKLAEKLALKTAGKDLAEVGGDEEVGSLLDSTGILAPLGVLVGLAGLGIAARDAKKLMPQQKQSENLGDQIGGTSYQAGIN